MGDKYGYAGVVKCRLLICVESPYRERPDECPLTEVDDGQARELVAKLRRRGLSNGGALSWHSGLCDEAADVIERLLFLEK